MLLQVDSAILGINNLSEYADDNSYRTGCNILKKHCPRNRQMQYIGSLMRMYDPSPVREFLEALDQGRHRQAAKTKRNEDY